MRKFSLQRVQFLRGGLANTHGGPDAPEAFMSDIGGLLPMAL